MGTATGSGSYLLEFLFRAALKLYPGDRPLWLQSTRLNFKDRWTTFFSVASTALFCVHRMITDRHASFPTHWKAHRQGAEDTEGANTVATARALGDFEKFTFTSLPSGAGIGSAEAQHPSFTSCRILGKLHSHCEPHPKQLGL